LAFAERSRGSARRPLASTKKTCPPATMNQEGRFHQAGPDPRLGNGLLILLDAESVPVMRLIWSDDVGMWNISAYHRGMMGGETPNIDRIAEDGMLFMDHYAQASCTAG
jgi:hypothetical protein